MLSSRFLTIVVFVVIGLLCLTQVEAKKKKGHKKGGSRSGGSRGTPHRHGFHRHRSDVAADAQLPLQLAQNKEFQKVFKGSVDTVGKVVKKFLS